MRRYNPQDIEPRWQKVWAESGIYKIDMGRTDDKFYIIPMLPYPSGDLHIGHWYNFGPTDTVARFNRMLGHNVFQTIGFDAFGLPAENAAIKHGISPAKWTRQNIANMTTQLRQIGASYDWEHSIAACDPDYYRWNQWLFLKLYEKKLAYRAKALVNWCPHDQTVLANEQVIGEDNVCFRCGHKVIQKEMESWYYKITDYADRLLDDLENVDWPKKVKVMQENWIGKSRGLIFTAPVKDTHLNIQTFSAHFEAFPADTFVVIAPEHPFLRELVEDTPQEKEVLAFAERMIEKRGHQGYTSEEDVEGIFTGRYIEDPVGNGDLPIWVASYALAHYGTGIVKCSAHDERDFRFAKKYDIRLKPVLFPADEKEVEKVRNLEYCFSDMEKGVLMEPAQFKGKVAGNVRDQVVDYVVKEGLAKETTAYRLRDWLISRQRYWGTPIPIIYCDKCGIQTVPEDQLPVVLPEDVEFTPAGRNPLLDRPDFVNTTCPDCGGEAKRETDTMDTFMDSSWYFLRYLDNKDDKAAFSLDVVNKWMPLDHYIGGIEHAILHLLYARFMTKFLHDHHGLAVQEPFERLTNQGIILGPDGQKMSKSRGNVVSPDEQVKSYGADSLRLYLMFMGPYEDGGPYNLGGIAGTRRFLDRFWTLVGEYMEAPAKPISDMDAMALYAATHRAIKKVTKDLGQLGFNTAIAAMMALINELYKNKAAGGLAKTPAWDFAIHTLTQLLAPFAPHIAEEIWHELGHDTSVHVSEWPRWDERLVQEEMLTIAVQVNGKVRAEIIVAKDAAETEIITAAQADENVRKYLADNAIKKQIYVPGRLVSLVV